MQDEVANIRVSITSKWLIAAANRILPILDPEKRITGFIFGDCNDDFTVSNKINPENSV
jgi:hypothetical protein